MTDSIDNAPPIDEEHEKFINIIKNHEFEFDYVLKNDKALANMLHDMIIKLVE